MAMNPPPAHTSNPIEWITQHQEVVLGTLVVGGILIASRLLKSSTGPAPAAAPTQVPVYTPTTEYYVSPGAGPGSCSAGYHWDSVGQSCVMDANTCAPGYHWDAVQFACIPDVASQCLPGYVLDPGSGICIVQCMRPLTYDPIQGKCVSVIHECSGGAVMCGGVCVSTICGAGQHFDQTACACVVDPPPPPPSPPQCPPGYTPDPGGQGCVPIIRPGSQCGPNQYWNETLQICVNNAPPPLVCPPGYTPDPGGQGCVPIPPSQCPPGAVWVATANLGAGGCVYQGNPPPGNVPPQGVQCTPPSQWSDRFQRCI